jgi:transcriptional regulator
VWAARAENPLVLFSVTGPFVYVPAAWNAQPGTPPETGVPTSYYASAQLRATATVTDDHDEIAAILRVQLARMQPDGGHAAVAAGAEPYGKLLPAIRGIRLRVEAVHAKFKFGGNRPPEHRLAVAERLAARNAPGDAASRQHLLRRLAAERRD